MKSETKKNLIGFSQFLIILSILCGMVYFADWVLDRQLYQPRCWIQEDDIGIDIQSDKKAIKQYPFDCKYFELK